MSKLIASRAILFLHLFECIWARVAMRSKLLYQRNLIGTFLFKNFYAVEWEHFHSDQNQIETFTKPPENVSSRKTHKKANSFEFAYLHVQEKEKKYNVDLNPPRDLEKYPWTLPTVSFGCAVDPAQRCLFFRVSFSNERLGYIFKGFALS